VNPIDVFYSWQSLLLAVAVSGIVQAVKTGIDTVYGTSPARRSSDAPGAKAHHVGKELRKGNALITRGLLPLLPILIGALLATLVPLRPDILTSYAEGKGGHDWTIYALWGAAIGQFADYIYQQIKRNLPGRFGSNGSSLPPSAPAPAPAPNNPPEEESVEDHPNA
jgi:hypothetical protein